MKVKTKQGIIQANRATLNVISIMFQEAAERYKQLGQYTLAEDARDVGKEIFQQLDKTGYYGNVS